MKTSIQLAVAKRAKDENVKTLRKAGSVPGVIYGNNVENQSITCKFQELHGVYMKAGQNTLVEVAVDGGKKIPSLIHAVHYEPVSGRYEHVDFYAVDMSKKVTTQVPVILEGESPAVKEQGGILVTVHDKLTVSCLPSDIPHQFTIKIDTLAAFGDTVTVATLKAPEGVTIQDPPDTVIVTVQQPRAEEVAVVATPAEGAVAADGTAAPAAGAEGAAAAPAGEKKDDKAGAAPAKAEKKK